jgi:hypothetical protein
MFAPVSAVELPAPPPPPPPADEVAAPEQAPRPDAPAPEAPPAAEADAPDPRVEVAPEPLPAAPEAIPQAGAAEAFLGVGGTEVPELLAIHLGLQDGQGLVVRTLDPNSPAAAAGIEENDVLVKVDGKPVASQRELREAVVARKPGDEVNVDVIQRGKPATKAVKLGERPAIGMAGGAIPLEGLAEEQAKRVREAIEQNMRAFEGLQGGGEEIVPEAMKQLEKRMQFMFRGLGGGDGGIQLQNSASIRMADPQGSVELQSKDGSKQIRVRDNDGKVQWEGPWDTDQDKAAAPDDIRARIERLNLGMIEDNAGGGLRLQILPRGLGGE